MIFLIIPGNTGPNTGPNPFISRTFAVDFKFSEWKTNDFSSYRAYDLTLPFTSSGYLEKGSADRPINLKNWYLLVFWCSESPDFTIDIHIRISYFWIAFCTSFIMDVRTELIFRRPISIRIFILRQSGHVRRSGHPCPLHWPNGNPQKNPFSAEARHRVRPRPT